MIHWPLKIYREIKRQARWYRDWPMLENSLKRFRWMPERNLCSLFVSM